jgi:hypothetical protein
MPTHMTTSATQSNAVSHAGLTFGVGVTYLLPALKRKSHVKQWVPRSA